MPPVSKRIKYKVEHVLPLLDEYYPTMDKCYLHYTKPYELLIATILSAQCTDDRVNKTTPSIFVKYSTPEDFVKIPIQELEELVHPCGFYRTKAKNIKLTAQRIIDEFGGKVPDKMEDLIKLPGVGRKTANVVMLEAFDCPQGIAVDTHAKRLSNKIGLSNEQDPTKIEQDLIKIIPKEYYKDVNHIFMWHGRNTCISRSPKCDQCCINAFCKSYKK